MTIISDIVLLSPIQFKPGGISYQVHVTTQTHAVIAWIRFGNCTENLVKFFLYKVHQISIEQPVTSVYQRNWNAQ